MGHHDIGGIPERGGGQGIWLSVDDRATFSRLASAWRATARFMRGRRDLVDRAAGVSIATTDFAALATRK